MPKRKELVALPGIELDAFCGHEGSGTPQSLPWAESKGNPELAEGPLKLW